MIGQLFSNFPLQKGLTATALFGGSYGVMELQTLDLYLRVASSACAFLVGVLTVVSALVKCHSAMRDRKKNNDL